MPKRSAGRWDDLWRKKNERKLANAVREHETGTAITFTEIEKETGVDHHTVKGRFMRTNFRRRADLVETPLALLENPVYMHGPLPELASKYGGPVSVLQQMERHAIDQQDSKLKELVEALKCMIASQV